MATRPWNTFDNRCDKCGSESFFRFSKHPASGQPLELFFCGHHGREFTPTLAAQGWAAEDYTDQINSKPSVSANAL